MSTSAQQLHRTGITQLRLPTVLSVRSAVGGRRPSQALRPRQVWSIRPKLQIEGKKWVLGGRQ